jgi:hypothetical protein
MLKLAQLLRQSGIFLTCGRGGATGLLGAGGGSGAGATGFSVATTTVSAISFPIGPQVVPIVVPHKL